MGPFIWLIDTVADIVFWVIIIQFALSILIQIQVIDVNSIFVQRLYSSLNRLLDPVLDPIRKILPDTGMIDFSPIILMIGLGFIKNLLIHLMGYI